MITYNAHRLRVCNDFLTYCRASRRGRASTAHATDGLRTLFDASNKRPLLVGRLPTKDGLHELHFEVHGRQDGTPALVVHGGPGAGCYFNHT